MIKLFHAPKTRSFTALWLLEELGQPYEVETIDVNKAQHRTPDFKAMNPLGKVPVVLDAGTPVSELGAIGIYLSDKYADTGLAPAILDPSRADYLRWCFFASAIVEPALAQKLIGFEIGRTQASWGSYDLMISMAEQGVAKGDWLTGPGFTTADLLVSSILRFGIMFGAISSKPLKNFVRKASDRPAFLKAAEIETELSVKMEKDQ